MDNWMHWREAVQGNRGRSCLGVVVKQFFFPFSSTRGCRTTFSSPAYLLFMVVSMIASCTRFVRSRMGRAFESNVLLPRCVDFLELANFQLDINRTLFQILPSSSIQLQL